ncbi:MAG: ClbS/DfsB family four-helix bundle protein [Bacteroidota bacterium]
MPIPQNKEELLAAIDHSCQKLCLDLDDIPPELTRLLELEGHAKGTQMSVADLLSYLIGWGQLVLKWQRLEKEGKEVHFPEEGFQWNELGQLAQKFYLDYAAHSFPELRQLMDKTVDDIRQFIQGQSNEALYHKSWYKQYTLGRMIQLNTASPYKNARNRIRKWKRSRKL